MARRFKMTAEEEIQLANKMRQAEESARLAIQKIPQACAILDRRPIRGKKTMTWDLERLDEAVNHLVSMARFDSDIRAQLGTFMEDWKSSMDIRWHFVMRFDYVAKAESKKFASNNAEVMEGLWQEGRLGLLDAIKRFEPSRKLRFSTYAKWWVKARIHRYLTTEGSMIRLPGGLNEVLRNIKKMIAQYEDAGVAWTSEMIAQEVGLTAARVETVLCADLLKNQSIISFETPIESGPKQRSVRDFLLDEGQMPIDDKMELEEEHRLLWKYLSALPDKERKILSLRFGLEDDGDPQTLQRIASRFKVSRERIRQIERKALKTLRDQMDFDNYREAGVKSFTLS